MIVEGQYTTAKIFTENIEMPALERVKKALQRPRV